MVQPKTENSPKDWNDLWEPHNKERWMKKAAERISHEGETTEECPVNRPMDWDMWQPSKKR
ncbi:hypothetical protein [Halodesulfovibrio marinisediminis]|uniref:Uncharacterized protein n=1 Tax=Halodesulfovibrio marinisediminis DSM 17456 TaxID=1121457 RepID=A0A1N6E0D6_9BACT|nr:hypothetical protein [Halodesulfovibrio marinisediminis]SIN76479.1 hypothetical protein SAMN02745161_0616 [Halodesulfovibrio marinisediminis DSM 17456]